MEIYNSLKYELQNSILNSVLNHLTEGVANNVVDEPSGLQLKLTEFIIKTSIEELEETLKQMGGKKPFHLYEINPTNGTKRCIRKIIL